MVSMNAEAIKFEIERLQACCKEYREEIEEYQSQDKERRESDHYGPYGVACMNTGQFDAGECYLCAGLRKQTERNELRVQVAEFVVEAGLANERYDAVCEELTACNAEGVADLEMRFEAMKTKAANMQLAAGRYQYMHEHAQQCINKIDDLFEYAYLDYQLPVLQRTVRKHLKAYMNAVARVATAVPMQQDSIVDTVKARVDNPQIIEGEFDLDDL